MPDALVDRRLGFGRRHGMLWLLAAEVAVWLALYAAGATRIPRLCVAAATTLTCTFIARRRAHSIVYELPVWRLFAIALGFVGAGMVGNAVLFAARPGAATDLGHTVDGVPFTASVLLACIAAYRGLLRWNRFQTLVSDPSDWLNGMGSVFLVAAFGNLAVRWIHTPLQQWPWWQLQGWMLRASALLILTGTGVTIAIIGGLSRDVRVWLITGAFGLVLTCEVISVALYAAPFAVVAQLGWVVGAAVITACVVQVPRDNTPMAATMDASVLGAVIVLVGSTVVLLIDDVFAPAGIRPPAVYAVLALACASAQGLHIIGALREVAQTRLEARSDELTGVPNRRELVERLHERVAKGSAASLLIIDLDRFKEVNDRFGHLAGDALLRRASGRLLNQLPADALLARLGGDEFAVLLDDSPVEESVTLAYGLVDVLTEPIMINGYDLSVGASIGVAAISAQRLVGASREAGEELLRRADVAMYLAKRSGGGVSVYDIAVDAAAQERLRRLEELRVLLAKDAPAEVRDCLRVYYQPQVDITTGIVVGAEALVRWHNPRLGVLGPSEFLDLVEENGLIGELTSRVLYEATAQLVEWRGTGPPMRMSVNLSPDVLASSELPALLDAVLQATPLEPSDLVLEITESSFMSDPSRALGTTREIARRGIGVSIDDFGTGYSSLAYLNDLPATEVKLDRSFIRRVTTDERTAAIVAGTVQLAHDLGARVVAEGVEDLAALERLRSLGCDEIQGFLVGKPMPPDEFLAWYRHHSGLSSVANQQQAMWGYRSASG